MEIKQNIAVSLGVHKKLKKHAKKKNEKVYVVAERLVVEGIKRENSKG